MRVLRDTGHQPFGIDLKASPYTNEVGSIADRPFVKRCVSHAEAVIHTATLHKPHVATHSRQAFVDTNITGTLNLLEEASAAHVKAFVHTSTTSVLAAPRGRPPPRRQSGSPKRSSPSRETSTASPSSLRNSSAICFNALEVCPVLC